MRLYILRFKLWLLEKLQLSEQEREYLIKASYHEVEPKTLVMRATGPTGPAGPQGLVGANFNPAFHQPTWKQYPLTRITGPAGPSSSFGIIPGQEMVDDGQLCRGCTAWRHGPLDRCAACGLADHDTYPPRRLVHLTRMSPLKTNALIVIREFIKHGQSKDDFMKAVGELYDWELVDHVMET